jgi:pimeloyl-ACP methyl ester carboxylesterase
VTATISLVAGSQPDGLIAAGARLTASIASLEAQIAAQRGALAQLTTGWQGDAARAALARAEKNLQRQHQLHVRLQAMQSALNSGGGQLSALRTHILSTAGQATSLGGLVSDDGSVRATGAGLVMTPALAAAYTALLKKLLDTFDAVDRATASALANAGLPQGPPHPSAPIIPGKGTDPNEVQRWWDSLTDAERQRLADEQPERIGNLNGIPVTVRDYANRKVLHQDLDRVRRAAADAGVPAAAVLADPGKYGLTQTDVTRYRNAEHIQRGIEANAETDANGVPKNPVFLHTYEPEEFGGQGRAALAIGNPDEADNTTVVVPGTGNSIPDRYFQRPDGLNVYKETQNAAPDKKTSVVLWMGYDAPDSPTDMRIAQTDLAREGGSMLAPDVNAFDVTNGDKDSHVTVIGHSYGSTTVADAAAGYGMRTDDVVLVGSPGTDLAKSAADFHLPEGGHVYVGAASSDPVSQFGSKQFPISTSPFDLPTPGIPIGLGTDPAVDGFGSTRFKAEVPGINNPFSDHSEYFTPGGESLYAIADITSGNGAMLEEHGMTARHRGEYILADHVDPELLRSPTTGHYH